MLGVTRALSFFALLAALLTGIASLPGTVVPARAQVGDPMGPPQPPPPPVPSERPQEDDEDDWKGARADREEPPGSPLADDFLPDFDGEWGLEDALLDELARMSAIYEDRATGFTAIETHRTARYRDGEAGDEDVRRYAYILRTTEDSIRVDEVRNVIKSGGRLGTEIVDAEPFPSAYTWIFLFHETNQPYFSYRLIGDHFEGFDWVHEIQFRGALPFTDGKDIRQWEGIILVDAVSNTPLEIRAQPSSQTERLRQQFQSWSKSWNIAGFRSGPRPFGYRCEVEFRERRSGLAFPSRLRYDTYRAVSPQRAVRWAASSRYYTDYRLFGVETRETVANPPASGP